MKHTRFACRHGLGIGLLLATALLASGCAGFSADGGMAAPAEAVRKQFGAELRAARDDADAQRIEQRVAVLLAQPLTADAAVQIALLNNRGLQASLAELGLAEADRVQAGRLPNPGWTFTRRTGGSEIEWERGLHLDLMRILLLPATQGVEARRFEQAQMHAAIAALSIGAEARKLWVEAVAAEESLRYARQVRDAADAGAELARRMMEAGNFNKLQQAREQAFYADATLNLARATQARLRARERLVRVLGLWGEQLDIRLPDRLPDLPATPRDQPDVERIAVAQRLDLQVARSAVNQMARNLGLSRATRFVHVLEFGAERSRTSDGHRERAWEIGFEIPLFDFGSAKVAKAESLYLQAVHRAADAAITARSQVREAYGAYRSAWDIARHHRDEIVPLRKRISEENLLRYNGMLIGVFDLLADARVQIASVNAAMDALRDYWLAQADLDMALIGKPSLPGPSTSAATPVEVGGAAH